ncbi:hypothetical protein [Mycobacterium sp.]|uniref:hypothetical protein n=1 Tax=Mycobacterium sp. TaxID=1785 RepID=UPI003F95BE9F
MTADVRTLPVPPPDDLPPGMTPEVWAGLTPMARDALQGIAAEPDDPADGDLCDECRESDPANDVTRLRQAVVAPLEIGWHHYLPSELLAMFAILSEAHESLSAFLRRAIGDGMYGGDA